MVDPHPLKKSSFQPFRVPGRGPGETLDIWPQQQDVVRMAADAARICSESGVIRAGPGREISVGNI